MGFDLEKLHRLLDDDRGLDDPRRAEERRAQLRRILEELQGPADHVAERTPGKRTAVEDATGVMRRFEPSARRAQHAFAKLPWQQRTPSFDDYRAFGLREVLARLDDRTLRRATIAAADPAIANRVATKPAKTSSAGGQALWRAAERRAATLYRYAQDAGEVASEDPVVEEALQRCGGGAALPEALRVHMERELGISLARVRIHTDAVAVAAAKAVRATAFTVGEDIFFAHGAYAPDTREGKQLLAHELTHVVQAYQGRTATSGTGIAVSRPGDTLEREADAAAQRITTPASSAIRTQPRYRSASAQPAAALYASGATMVLRQEVPRTSGGGGAEEGREDRGATHARAARESFEVRNWRAIRNTADESGAVSDGGTQLVRVQSGGIAANADVRALTPDAQRYSVGFVQTMHHSTRRAIYADYDGNIVNTYVASRGEVMDQRTDLGSPAPWYNYGVRLGSSERHPGMTDNPAWEIPRSTSDHWYVSRLEGSESFTTYLVAMVGNDASTIIYLGNVRWNVNWAGRFDEALHFHGRPAHIGTAAPSDEGGAVLSGPPANLGSMGDWAGAGSRGSERSSDRSAHAGPASKRSLQSRPVIQPAVKSGPQVQRKAVLVAGIAGGVAIPSTVLVDEQGQVTEGQLRKQDFLARLDPALKAIAKEELGAAWSVAGCPYIPKYLALYGAKPAAEVEKFIRRYTGSKATDATTLFDDVLKRVRVGIVIWRETGKLPSDVSEADPAAAVAAEYAADDGPALQKKADGQATAAKSKPLQVLEQLGEGAPLDPSTQARMERAFGTSFSDVRIHADSQGNALAREEGALAFAVGTHIAFAPGRYQPGSVEGDALLAHELTHVLQQRGATASASKDVSEVGDSAEQDADRAAASAVAQLHGDEKAAPDDKAGANVSSDLQLQRCIGTLNEGEQEMIDAQLGIWSQQPTFDGDPFFVKITKKVGTGPMQGRVFLDAHFDYRGTDDPDGSKVSHYIETTYGKTVAPKVSSDRASDWRTLTVDVHGDGSRIHTFTHETVFLDGWNPRSREHIFTSNDPKASPLTKTMIVKSRDALPGKTANTPVSAADANLDALRIDIAAITTKRWLDDILSDASFGLDAKQPPWVGLKQKVDADAAKYTSNVVDAHDEALRLTRLGQVVSRARPMLRALGAASKKEAYLPEIAEECVQAIDEVRKKYATGIAASWDGPATTELNAADAAFNAVWFRISGLYLDPNRGVQGLITGARGAANDVVDLRHSGGRSAFIYTMLESKIGLPGATPGAPATNPQPALTKMAYDAAAIREAFIRGETGSLAKVQKIVEDTQVMVGLSCLLATNEIFYHFKKEIAGIIGTVADKSPGTRNLTRVCEGYIKQFETLASGVEAALQSGKDLNAAGRDAVNKFSGICNDKQFKTDLDDIKSRIKTITVIATLGKVLAIVGIAALTGGAAGAMFGGALEGAGASAAVIATGEFAAEVIVFTAVSRLGNEAVFGKSDTGWTEELITNAMMFGFLKAASAAYGRVFKVFADPRAHKTGFAVGGMLTGVAGLQVFAELHYLYKNHKAMGWDDRVLGMFTNAVMVAAMALGGYLAKPRAERIRQDMLVFVAKNLPGALERIEAKLLGLKGELEGLQGGKANSKDTKHLLDLLGKVESLWNEQISVLAEAAKLEKTNKAEAAKAFKEQVDMMVKEIAKLDLQLSAAGVEINLGTNKGGNFFRPLSPGYVAFKAEGLEVAKDYYKNNGGTFAEVKGKEGLYSGKDASGETFFIADSAAHSFFDAPSIKPPTEAEAKANRLEAQKARLLNKQRAEQLRKLLNPHVQDGHVMQKFGRVINGTGLAAAMDANTLPGAAKDAHVGPLEALPETIGIGTGQETFAKLGDTPIGQAAPEISGGGGWAQGASPADMTSNHGNYTSAANVADAVALTQLRSGVPILDASVKEVSVAPDASWKVPDAKVRLKVQLKDGTEVFIYSDATDIATGLGPPKQLDTGQIHPTDPAKAASIKTKLEGDGRLVYGDTVGVQKGGEKVLISGGSATGAWNAKVARKLGALVDWIAKDWTPNAPPKSEHAARKYQQVQEKLNAGELTPAEAEKQMADLRAFDSAALPRNVQDADAAMNDAGVTRHVKEIESMTPTEDIAGEAPGKVKVTFKGGTSGIYDQVVVSHGTNLAGSGQTPGALSLAGGIAMRPIVVDGQVVALESVNPPGAVRVVGAAMWSRAWLRLIPEHLSVNGGSAREVFDNAMTNQALNAPRDSPGNPLIHNVGKQIPAANKAIGGGPDLGGVKGSDVYQPNTVVDPASSAQSVKTLTSGQVQSGVVPLESKKLASNADVKVAPGTVNENGATMTMYVPTSDTATATVNVTLQIKAAGDLKAPSVHGEDTGPARLEVTKDASGNWTARIEISSATKAEDLPFVLRHELNEAATLVKRNPGGPPKDGFGAQMDSALLKKGAKKGATPTPHDIAGAIEVTELYHEWQRLEAAKSPEAPHRKGVLDRAMEANGLNEAVEVDAKKDLLKSQGAPKELVGRVGSGPWKAPKSWNGPSNHGEWLGDRGDSAWIDSRPEVIRVVGLGPDGRANPIVFRRGVVDFTPWSRGELTVEGLTGQHKADMKLIRLAIADQQKLEVGSSPKKREQAALDWLRDADDGFGGKGLRPHHAGGSKIQLVPKDVHKVQHTDLAVYPE